MSRGRNVRHQEPPSQQSRPSRCLLHRVGCRILDGRARLWLGCSM
ncbi:Hypothetical protein A7982_06272 [Minicystis rosea]|nr:Hypothetical protein A7982_06272 [Minicystis rosea]